MRRRLIYCAILAMIYLETQFTRWGWRRLSWKCTRTIGGLYRKLLMRDMYIAPISDDLRRARLAALTRALQQLHS